MPRQARPTLRCLREDPALVVPRAGTPLDEIAHPLLAKVATGYRDPYRQPPSGQEGRAALASQGMVWQVMA
jgi:hypothetical protein